MKTLYLDFVPLSTPKKRHPVLRIRILESLAMINGLSKSGAKRYLKANYSKEHNYPEISEAFDDLKHRELIVESCIKESGRGKPEKYYKITEKGLASIIAEDPTPKRFWSLLTGFCYYTENIISSDVVNTFCKFFLCKHLKYPSRRSHASQITSFNNLCRKWIRKNLHNTINLAQKVLETLAVSPRITLQELARKTNQSKEKVDRIIDSYTMRDRTYSDVYYIDEEEYSERVLERYVDFLYHSIVIERFDTSINSTTYELSLFGILLTMYLIRHRDISKIELFHNAPLEDYYDDIATKYPDKLPLIFAKWPLLKRYLKTWSASNFDILFIEKEARIATATIGIPVTKRGCKEIFESMHSLLYHNEQLTEFVDAGFEIYDAFKRLKVPYLSDNNRRPNDGSAHTEHGTKNILPIYQKLKEIQLLSTSAESITFQEELFQEERKKYEHRSKKDRYDMDNFVTSPVEILAEEFAEEVTFLYYFNLYSDVHSPLMPGDYNVAVDYSEPISQSSKNALENHATTEDADYVLPGSPKERLLMILKYDERILETFRLWLNDVLNYQKAATESILEIYRKVTNNAKR